MSRDIKFDLPEKLFLKDPQDSKFGQKLLQHTIVLMHELGFEQFTFKKLATAMSSAEVSIYRYFENKHLLLLYLNSWYWEWVHYLIDFHTVNIEDPRRKLKKVLHSIIFAAHEQDIHGFANQKILQEIMIQESSKSYHIRDVDKENKDGLFISYKLMVNKIADIIKEVNPEFDYPRTLSSTVFEMVNNQIYYAEHLPRLTDLKNKKTKLDTLEIIVNKFVFAALDAS